jgi:hypothetical protein
MPCGSSTRRSPDPSNRTMSSPGTYGAAVGVVLTASRVVWASAGPLGGIRAAVKASVIVTISLRMSPDSNTGSLRKFLVFGGG